MRATGFFFETDAGTFLITARHNVLPTEVSSMTPDGNPTVLHSTDLTLPRIDVFLRTNEGFDCYRYDIRETEIRQTSEIDTIGVRVDVDPESYGYRVWQEGDLVDRIPTSKELSTIGFDGDSFPSTDTDYDSEMYRETVGKPRMLTLTNPLPNFDESKLGLELIAIDEAREGNYRCLSGAPVLGDQLAGIHIADVGTQSLKHDYGDIRRIVYTRSAVLPELLG